MPDIVNFLETELRYFNMGDYAHKARGQHPEAWNRQFADNEIITERMRDSPIIDLEQDLHDQDIMVE
eukprot:6585473-Heterocapsa_arctica.AAC.1